LTTSEISARTVVAVGWPASTASTSADASPVAGGALGALGASALELVDEGASALGELELELERGGMPTSASMKAPSENRSPLELELEPVSSSWMI
jgi:hypothetical protein